MRRENIAGAEMELALFQDAAEKLLEKLGVGRHGVLKFYPAPWEGKPANLYVLNSGGNVQLMLELS